MSNDIFEGMNKEQIDYMKNSPSALAFHIMVENHNSHLEAVAKLYEQLDQAENTSVLTDDDRLNIIREANLSPYSILWLMRNVSAGAREQIRKHISSQNSKNASSPRKMLPSKQCLLALKNEFRDNYFLEHGIATTHGWIKYAIEKLAGQYGFIDYKTINKILNS